MSKVFTTAALVAVAVQFFENYPTHEEVFITEDGQPFFEENRAILHTDNKGISYKRFVRGFEDVEVQPLVVGKDTPKGEGSPEYRGANPDEEKARYEQKVKELSKLELVSKNYQKMRSLVQYFNLEVGDFKAETLIEALEVFKQQLTENGTLTGNAD